MKCEACAATIPDDAQFCSACGTDVGSPKRSEPVPADREISLAAANLLRLRKRFAEAEARCIEVLRADPNNVHGHSMLGDIYLDQGRRDDARQWYQLALDLDPKSRADLMKLSKLRSGDEGRSDDAPGDDRFAGLSSLTWVRFAGLALAVFICAAAISLGVRRLQRDRQPEAPVVALGAPMLKAPSLGAAPDRLSLGAGAPAGAVAQEWAPESSTEAQDEPDTTVHREMAVETAIATALGASSETRLRHVMLCGEGDEAAVTLHRRVEDDDRARRTEDDIVTDGLRAVHAAMQAAETLTSVDVIVRLETASAPEHTAFRARADRGRVARDTTIGSADRALRAFTWYRWTPACRSYEPTGAEISPGP
ncbi:MAG: tetratricopeptide repeat protein [Armatimonadetes bacterium]|nr:tetratricopeptide repeat protein [Armatimonadota bacterium]